MAVSRSAPTDAELLRRTPDDPDAFVAVHDRWSPALHRWARSRFADDAQAADVVAETFAQALTHAGRFRDDAGGSAGPWLFGIAANVARRTWRRGGTDRGLQQRLGGWATPHVDPGYEEAERRADAASAADELHAALAHLPAEQREAVRLRVVEELSYDEVAARLACTNQAARLRVSRGLRGMRRVLVLAMLTALLLAALAVATGVVPSPFGAVRGDPVRITALDGRGAPLGAVICDPDADRSVLCRRVPGAGPGVAQTAERLRRLGADAGVVVSAQSCVRHRCRDVAAPRADVLRDRPGVSTYLRSGVRVPARPRRTGGYRGSPSAGVTYVTLPGRARQACGRRATTPAVCAALRAWSRRTPVVLADLASALGARRVVLETATACRLDAKLRCRGIPVADALRRSARPNGLAPGSTAEYARTVVVAGG
jgi:RNA polymerase sigma factor (sigma-70 family)